MQSYYDFVRTHPEGFIQFSCKGILFLKMECPPDFIKADDWFVHNCFLHVLSGKKLLSSREQSWEIQKGDTIFLKKGAISLERRSAEAFCGLMFFVPDEYIRSFIKEKAGILTTEKISSSGDARAFPIRTTPVLSAFYESVIPYFSTLAKPAENLLELKFCELLLHIVTTESNPALKSYLFKLAQTGMDDLPEVMENNCLFNLQLNEYARLCHRSLSSFKRDFHAVFATAPGRWLSEKRLNHAAHLLLHSSKSITEVVLESGFTNITHFDKVFKKQFGMSPLRYRKNITAFVA